VAGRLRWTLGKGTGPLPAVQFFSGRGFHKRRVEFHGGIVEKLS